MCIRDSANGYPYAVVSTNDEYTLSLVFNKYKNNDEDYEIVLEKYIKKSSTQNLVDFYLVNTKTLEVTDQQRDYWYCLLYTSLWLSSDQASHTTGQKIFIDGGMHIA